jgi:prepilin-type N-terminal cleavage/methylation domain-containing protein
MTAARRARAAGFTLIELLCVVVILAIASAMIIPAIGDNSGLNASAAARQLMADLNYAQNQAINTQQYVYVTFDTTDQTYSLCSSMNPQTCLTDPISQGAYTRSFGSGTGPLASCTLLPTDIGSNSTTIAYDPLGTPCVYSGTVPPPSATSTITLGVECGSSNIVYLNIEPDSGEISIQ